MKHHEAILRTNSHMSGWCLVPSSEWMWIMGTPTTSMESAPR